MTSAGESNRPLQPDEVIAYATMVRESRLWPDEMIEDARRTLRTAYYRAPTLEELAERFGIELVREVANRVVGERVAELTMERMGQGSPCHLCSGPRHDHDPMYEFGLAQILEEKKEWGGVVAALAMNVLTIPLGVAMGATPGTSTKANVARCRLVMCETCARPHRRFFGGLKIREADCARHPSWGRLYDAGYTRFLDHEALERFR